MGDKLSVVDIKATDSKGRWYNIEIQVKEQKYYGQRAIFYLSEAYANQLAESENYDKLRKTIIISLLDFDYFRDDSRYFRRCCYKDFDTGQLYRELDFADLYFVELRKFDKLHKGVTTLLERWITFLNRAAEFDRDSVPEELRDPDILQAIDTIETMSLSAREREYYQSAKKVMRDAEAVMMTAIENAVDNALESRNVEIARTLKANGVSPDLITLSTGLSLEQIEKL